jgi:hypothetical protein
MKALDIVVTFSKAFLVVALFSGLLSCSTGNITVDAYSNSIVSFDQSSNDNEFKSWKRVGTHLSNTVNTSLSAFQAGARRAENSKEVAALAGGFVATAGGGLAAAFNPSDTKKAINLSTLIIGGAISIWNILSSGLSEEKSTLLTEIYSADAVYSKLATNIQEGDVNGIRSAYLQYENTLKNLRVRNPTIFPQLAFPDHP